MNIKRIHAEGRKNAILMQASLFLEYFCKIDIQCLTTNKNPKSKIKMVVLLHE